MTELPSANEPLRLADGRVVYPGGDVVDSRATDRLAEVGDRVLPARVRRKASDLPAPPQQMNTIAAVLAYTLYGLDDEEITAVIRLGTAVIAKIKASDPYKQMHDAIIRSALEQETDAVRDIITKSAKRAALTVVDSLDAGSRTDRMAAARDILDRSGLRPTDVVEHRHRMDGGLTIEIVRRDELKSVPTIEIEEGE